MSDSNQTAVVINTADEEADEIWSTREFATSQEDKIEAKENETEETETDDQDYPLENIEQPHKHDVMCGRGAQTNYHPGNKKFRNMVESRKMRYVKSKKSEKPLIALEIVQKWRQLSPPGRFLKPNKETGKWDDVGNRRAKRKTIQALRENAPQIRKQQQEQIDKAGDKGVKTADQKETDKKEILTRTHSFVRGVHSFWQNDFKNEGSKEKRVSRLQLPHQEDVDEFPSFHSIFSITGQPESLAQQFDFQSKRTDPDSPQNAMDINKTWWHCDKPTMPAYLDDWQYDSSSQLEPSISKMSPPRGSESHHWGLPCRAEAKRDISKAHETNSPRVKKAALRRDLSAISNRLKQKYIPEYFNQDMQSLNIKTKQIRLALECLKPSTLKRLSTTDALVIWANKSAMKSMEQDIPRERPLLLKREDRKTTEDAMQIWMNEYIVESMEQSMSRPSPLKEDDRKNTNEQFLSFLSDS